MDSGHVLSSFSQSRAKESLHCKKREKERSLRNRWTAKKKSGTAQWILRECVCADSMCDSVIEHECAITLRQRNKKKERKCTVFFCLFVASYHLQCSTEKVRTQMFVLN